MSRKLMCLVSIGLLMLIVSACGDQGVSGGRTVYMTSSLKQGTTGIVFGRYSVNSIPQRVLLAPNPVNFTLVSKPYTDKSTIKISDVVVDSITVSFSPQSNSMGSISNTFTSSLFSAPFPYSGSLTANGTLDIENIPILRENDLSSICGGVTLPTTQNYSVNIRFYGKEITTGIGLSAESSIRASVDCY